MDPGVTSWPHSNPTNTYYCIEDFYMSGAHNDSADVIHASHYNSLDDHVYDLTSLHSTPNPPAQLSSPLFFSNSPIDERSTSSQSQPQTTDPRSHLPPFESCTLPASAKRIKISHKIPPSIIVTPARTATALTNIPSSNHLSPEHNISPEDIVILNLRARQPPRLWRDIASHLNNQRMIAGKDADLTPEAVYSRWICARSRITSNTDTTNNSIKAESQQLMCSPTPKRASKNNSNADILAETAFALISDIDDPMLLAAHDQIREETRNRVSSRILILSGKRFQAAELERRYQHLMSEQDRVNPVDPNPQHVVENGLVPSEELRVGDGISPAERTF